MRLRLAHVGLQCLCTESSVTLEFTRKYCVVIKDFWEKADRRQGARYTKVHVGCADVDQHAGPLLPVLHATSLVLYFYYLHS